MEAAEEDEAEEMEMVEETHTSGVGGKRKRQKNSKATDSEKALAKKKEEDVGFICFDGESSCSVTGGDVPRHIILRVLIVIKHSFGPRVDGIVGLECEFQVFDTARLKGIGCKCDTARL